MSQKELNKTLMIAIQMGNAKAVQQAISEGADVNFESLMGETPLLRAIKMGNEEIFKLLLSKGADVNKSDAQGKTPLMMAHIERKIDFAKELRKKGANKSDVDVFGHTADDYLFEDEVGLVVATTETQKKQEEENRLTEEKKQDALAQEEKANEQTAKEKEEIQKHEDFVQQAKETEKARAQEVIKEETAQIQELEKQIEVQKQEERAQEEKIKEQKENEQKLNSQKESDVLKKVLGVIAVTSAEVLFNQINEEKAVEKSNLNVLNGFALTSAKAAELMRYAKEEGEKLGVSQAELMEKTALFLLIAAGKENQTDVVKNVMAYVPNFLKEGKGLQALHMAAQKGNVDVMSEFLYHKADLSQGKGQSSVLYQAGLGGNLAMVKFLLSKGVAVGQGEESALIGASKGKNPKVLEAVLLRADKKDAKGFEMAFECAVDGGQKALIDKLLNGVENKLVKKPGFRFGKKYGVHLCEKMILKAALKANYDMVNFLSEKLGHVKTPSLLCRAILSQNKKLIASLIEKGACVNDEINLDKVGCSALNDKALTGKKINALALATILGDFETVSLLTAEGANPNKEFSLSSLKEGIKSYKPIIYAGLQNDWKTVLKLVQNKADVNVVSANGETVLDMLQKGANENTKKIAEVLKEYGAKTARELKNEKRNHSFANRMKDFLRR